jgi:penicillin amidase
MTSNVETIAVGGISRPVEICVDRWGIAHVDAQNEDDLFFAQGFNAARDRLWQLDLWRKRGLGLLAADFGPGYLAQDFASRLFLYRGSMEEEWVSYSDDARAICTSFVAGINAYIALCEREPDRLPPEFAEMKTRPARWSPEDVVRIRSHAMTRNIISEVLRARISSATDPRNDMLRKVLEPEISPKPAGGIDPSGIPLDALTLYKLATTGVTFSADRLAAGPDDAWRWTKVTDLGEVVAQAEFNGSNNWAVSPAKSTTGRPIMASDPHRNHSVPSLRYLVHLRAPGLDVIGTGEPSAPGISMGHNGHAAFSMTLFYADQEDLYVYETEENGRGHYRYGDGWEAMEQVQETFMVRGVSEQRLTLKFTRHGPVIFEDPANRRAYAVRTVWSAPGTAAYLRSLHTMRVRDKNAFLQSIARWYSPSANHVYADLAGDVLWCPSGAAPVRPNWDGLFPVPGDGRFEWQGFLDHSLMPRRINPPEGYVASANAFNLPDGYPHTIGYEWIENSRATRIHAVLGQPSRHSPEDSRFLQTDVQSRPAARLQQVLARAAPAEASRRALAFLGDWDCRLEAGSAAAALFEVWWTKHLKPELFSRLVPCPDLRVLLAPGDVEGILRVLEAPDDRFGDDPTAARDALLRDTLAAAWAECAARLGDDPSGWSWGRLHHALFEHALSAVCDGVARLSPDVGPFPHGGSASTPMHTGYRPGDFRTVMGASVRMVVDVGNWDGSTWINAPGQSGDPRSPHYRDLAPIWARGEYVPMLYSKEAVAAATEQRIVLLPAEDGAEA